jgi:hypothetical protein
MRIPTVRRPWALLYGGYCVYALLDTVSVERWQPLKAESRAFVDLRLQLTVGFTNVRCCGGFERWALQRIFVKPLFSHFY